MVRLIISLAILTNPSEPSVIKLIIYFQQIKQKNMQNLSTHAPQNKESSLNWQGIKSAKFTGGRFHQNHPRDELDTILTSNKPPQAELSGKKQFERKGSYGSGQFKTHLKTFDIKYQKSKIFQIEELEKLIKVPFHDRAPLGAPERMNAHLQTIGKSKIKAMQKGDKRCGIYRNFYKGQTTSVKVISNY